MKAKPARKQPLHLTEAERRILETLIADRPHLTNGQLRKLFELRAGVSMSKASMLRAMKEGFRPRGTGRPGSQLGSAEREVLATICLENAPAYRRLEIRREYAARTGRYIAAGSVSSHLIEELGLPRLATSGLSWTPQSSYP